MVLACGGRRSVAVLHEEEVGEMRKFPYNGQDHMGGGGWESPPWAPPVHAAPGDPSDMPPVRCMSLACQSKGHCAPIGMSSSMPPRYIYPPDCATGAAGIPYGNDTWTGHPETADGGTIWTVPDTGGPAPSTTPAVPAATSGIAEMFQGMSTTTLLLLAAGAYFFFFRKR